MAEEVANIVEFVPMSARPNLTILSVFDCQSIDYPDNREDKGIKACLLNIRHHTASSSSGNSYSRIMTYSSYSQQRGGSATRPRLATPASYDRILFFGDLSSTSGQCFAMILPTSSDSRHILEYARSNVAVGQAFVIVEPHAVSHSLSLGLPLVTTDNPLLPLTARREDVPMVPMRLPNMNETLYFASHGKEVVFSGVSVISRNVSCKGTLCDRQAVVSALSRAKGCGCLHVGKDAGIVLECRIRFAVPMSFDASGSTGVDNVRSWRLTRLFLTVPNAPQLLG